MVSRSPAISSRLYSRRCSTATNPIPSLRRRLGDKPIEVNSCQVASSNFPHVPHDVHVSHVVAMPRIDSATISNKGFGHSLLFLTRGIGNSGGRSADLGPIPSQFQSSMKASSRRWPAAPRHQPRATASRFSLGDWSATRGKLPFPGRERQVGLYPAINSPRRST